MHVAVRGGIGLVLLLVVVITGMAVLGVCPPAGPWPQPPWCISSGGAAFGTPSTVSVYVSVPPHSAGPVMFARDGSQPVAMTPAGTDGWAVTVMARTGDIFRYHYTSGTRESAGSYVTTIGSARARISDGVWGWTGEPFIPRFNKDFSVGLFMSDTWGKNYNFMMFEDTRQNTGSSFERAAKTGATAVYVTDFHRAIFDNASADWVTDTGYHFEGEVFENDMRDEMMTQEDLNRLAATAHENGMKIGWKTNMHFVDIGKYIAPGFSGTGSQVIASDWDRWSKTPRTAEWTRVYFSRYRALLLEKAAMLNEAGFDEMIITPGWHTPNFHPNEDMANELWTETIRDVKNVFTGRVGIVLDTYGFMDGNNVDEDWTRYDYYATADDCYYYLYFIPPKFVTSQDTDRATLVGEFNTYLDTLEANAKEKGITLRLVPGFFSYKNGVIAHRFDIDPLDILNPAVKEAEADWTGQAEAYDALFMAAEGRERISGIIPNGYAWDDSMDPDVPPKISIGIQFLAKPAEGVITRWAQAVKTG